jgi:long-chain fatty acid transport protein
MSGIVSNLLKFLLAALIIKSCVGRLWANGFGLPDQDAFAMGRGEAFVATADNPSAIYYNPAGITQLKGDNLRGGVYGIYLDPSYRNPNNGNTYYSSDNLAAVPQVFYVHSLEKLPLSFGLGVYFPYGGNMDWPQDTGFREIAVSASLKYVTIDPTIAWKILPSLSIAAGAMVNYVDLKTSQGLPVFSPQFINYFDFRGSGWSAGYNVGILWKPEKKISIGATFRSSATVTLDGQTHYEIQPLISPAVYNSANMSLTFPWTVVGGISYRPTQKWNLELDANYTHWSSLNTFNLHQDDPQPPLHSENTVNFGWQGSWIGELGVTRYFDHGWHVSAGYAFNQNSVPNTYYTPWVADLNRHLFSLGFGRTGKRFDFDAAYQLGYGPSHTVTGSQPSLQVEGNITQSADGQYGFFSSAFIISAGIHF